jgi:hypothetical protein
MKDWLENSNAAIGTPQFLHTEFEITTATAVKYISITKCTKNVSDSKWTLKNNHRAQNIPKFQMRTSRNITTRNPVRHVVYTFTSQIVQ